MFSVGQLVGHFKIVKKIGEGGMGAVYLAEDQKLGRKVALKVLLPEFFDNAERSERFTREARTAAQISHANVTGIYEIGASADPESDADLQYIVMEYVAGQSLSNYITDKSPDMKELVRLAEKIADGISAAHKLNIVHRDIKADNILVDEDGQPKILDFGLAKPVDVIQFEGDGDSTNTVSQELTRAGKIMGTVSYMSPEQARGENVDTRSDIFSFGVLLYRMVTGRFPFSGDTQVSTLAKILEVRHESPRKENDQIPSELERIIDKCLQKDAQDRYQDARDLAVDLRALRRQFDSGMTDSISGVVTAQTATPQGKSWMGWLVAAAIVIVLGAFFWPDFKSGFVDGVLSGGRVEAGENNLAIFGFANKTGDESLDWLTTGLPEILLTDLSQSGSMALIGQERLLDHVGRKEGIDLSHDRLTAAARELGATQALSGSFFKLGNQIRIDARLEDLSNGQIVFAEKVVGDDPFTLVDSLTAKIAVSLNMTEAMASNTSVSQYTSSSPEAYRNYLRGMDLFLSDRYDEAIDAFKKALEYDSTFAMPYLRIGMTHVFHGRQQQGQPYFEQAAEFVDRLPERDRKLLDIYLDIWNRQQFSAAFDKMERFVKQFPNDKEGRSIMGLLYGQLAMDSTRAFAQLDTALMLDEDFVLAKGFYVQLLREYDQIDRAIALSEQIAEEQQGSPIAYSTLGRLYQQRGRTDDAKQIYGEMLALFPQNRTPYEALHYIYIDTRQFDSALVIAERMRSAFADDPFDLAQYNHIRANLANWSGNFRTGLDFRHKALERANESGDTAAIRSAYGALSSYYQRFDQLDSALYYSKLGFRHSDVFQRLNYPLLVVEIDPGQGDYVRPIMQEAIADSKAIIPEQMWPLMDGIYEMFEGFATADTARLLSGLEMMATAQRFNNTGNNVEFAELLVLSGNYQRGLEFIDKIIGGDDRSSNAWYYCYCHYLAGRAHQGLGRTAKAIEHFEEMLRYWNDPEILLDEISDAKSRLASLRG